jgi:uncharacterized protein
MKFSLLCLAFGTVLLTNPANAASFDCARAHAADERAVCASRVLSELDVEMAVRFETLAGLVAMGARGDMGDAQRAFLVSRRRCGGDASCLTALYRGRIAILRNQYDMLKQRGPF